MSQKKNNPGGTARVSPRRTTTPPHCTVRWKEIIISSNPTIKHENVPGLIEYTNEKKRDCYISK